jgi:NADH:ubiquinone oxidoreductase subunit K
MTLLNYWHYIFLGITFLMFVVGVFSAFRQKKKLVVPMLISVTIVSIFFGFFSVMVVDKYTKEVKLYKLKNKRLLSTEQIIYTGIVKNTGKFSIGEVTIELKLVNKGHATGNVKGGNFYKVSSFFDFLSGMGISKSKPQSITKEFVVAKNLKPGAAKSFRVYFRYPPYFRSVADFAKVSGR